MDLITEKFGWKPRISFERMVREMIQSDLEESKKDELCKNAGYSIFNGHE